MRGKRRLSRIRKPVRRKGAETNLLLTLLSFAFSVAATRLFLEITGFPQLGGGELHIAHVLWGGLFLFLASLMPLILANRWVYPVSALVAGLGVGLFIDEVGKFITQTNDYFYPAAAPIVYAFFLLTVLLYLQVRKPFATDPRAELYRAFEALQEVLDRDLEPTEHAELEIALRRIQQTAKHPNIASLSNELLEFLASDSLVTVPETPRAFERFQSRLSELASRFLTEPRLRGLLVGGLAALGIVALLGLAQLILAAPDSVGLDSMIQNLVSAGLVGNTGGFWWFVTSVGLESLVGGVLLAASGLLMAKRDVLGIRLAYFGLLASIAVVNLLVFYFEQFSTIIPAAIQFALLGALAYYRRHFMRSPALTQPTIAEGGA
ncbi:MAG: hypothetical protein PVF70_07115 [Anaerolineales bacterium]|jgi:hypothetical protein